ncbi:MAG: spore germination protein [Ruminococcaceae bacterium]|nr:spore germination protein [Oscillospiraceae bacterium]
MSDKKLTADFEVNKSMLDELFGVGINFDVAGREMVFGTHRAKLYFIDSFMSGELFEKLLIFFAKLEREDIQSISDAKRFAEAAVPYGEVIVQESIDQIAYSVMSGTLCLMLDTFGKEVLIIDVRNYPSRSIDEPSNDKVLRGARDGFIEALKPNICMIRRRIRDTNFRAERVTVGKKSKTDVALCYISGVADEAYVNKLKEKLQSLDIKALTLGHQSLAEALVPVKWYNPFPKFRYTERPDTAAASILEGSVAVLCDASPEVMILPCGIFDFLQEASDYYLPPFTGCYLRVLRHFVFLLTLVLTPTWYLLIDNPNLIPEWLEFIKITEKPIVPIIAQLFLVEFALDGLKLASLNTPDTLSNSLSVVGGLILGDFAVQIGFLTPEVIVYMAIVAIANFTQASYELGFAFKFMRMLMLLLTALFDLPGYIASYFIIALLIVSNNTVDGSRSYLYPLLPFNRKALSRLLFRLPARLADSDSGHDSKK